MTEDQKPLSPKDAAAFLGVSARQVRLLLESGGLAGWRVGKLWRTDMPAIAAFKKKHGNQAGTVVDLKRGPQ
jgi:excisionase family DNA binding protein